MHHALLAGLLELGGELASPILAGVRPLVCRGRPSIAPERLLRAVLLQILYARRNAC